jgi:hypothetical protein
MMTDFELLQHSLQILFSVMTDPELNASKYEIASDTAIYMFESEKFGRVKQYVRQHGKPPHSRHDQNTEYYNARYGVEASISWSVNPDDPWNVEYYKQDSDVSILRCDREGRAPDTDPSDLETRRQRDSSTEIGSISVDIGSAMGGENVKRIGRLISLANFFKVEDNNRHERLLTEVLAEITSDTIRHVQMLRASAHHNDSKFDQTKYGTAAGFARVAATIMAMSEHLYAARKNQSNPNKLLNPDKAIETVSSLPPSNRRALRDLSGRRIA